MTALLLAVLAVCPCRERIDIDDLTGLWQANTCIAAGLSDVWLFCPDGAFTFRCSSMDWTQRLREFSGSFDVYGDTLRLLIISRTIEEGGYLVPNEGSTSIAGDSLLCDTETVIHELDPPLTLDLLIGFFGIETMEDNPELPVDLPRIDLDGITYWRFAADMNSAMELLEN